MDNPLQSAISESLPEDASLANIPVDVNQDKTPDSSTGETQLAEATASKAVEVKEPPFNEHPRWKEVQEEKRLAQLRADRLEQQLLEISSKLASPVTAPQDPYAGMNDEQRAFYQNLDERNKRLFADELKKQAEALVAPLRREVDTGKAVITSLLYERFQEKHPDIKPNSPEETAIAGKISQGYTLEAAYDAVVNPKTISQLRAENVLLKNQLAGKKINDKQAANLETTSVNLKQANTLKGREKTAALVEEWLTGQPS